ncbi:MAG: GntR family transcriptional regulator [Pseudotabrizicola sp.]|uniref:FadR/GntR family transcriptional regulator n=1 Tax=Pseudotabrizicola sp. TaxID=2939647 RepID=UPI00271A8ED4|nr:GntR family transcriptional regulator [Pseudotabrizicola sp.]MDO8882434.1 GntR family transcriptional regulator [Pseudotabrizicola sp.]MDP2081526.1 GntR family transcriptional regulator [Pseudotabrizicola sp.]MDZ7575729.1 GntR family transcriptional regulator [Pseudotabrizicola sp.]
MSEPGSLVRALSGRQTARNYHSYVIAEVGLGIASGRFAVGSILPNDAEMMGSYGVSRTVLREALKTLEAKGLVEARAKVGTRVLSRSRWNLFDRQVLAWIQEAGPDAAFLASFVELREQIEMQTATLAAARRTAEQVRMMHYWLNQRSAMATLCEPFALAEFEIHRTLCEASHNPFLRATSGLVEFGVVQATLARIKAGVSDFAAEKSAHYKDLTDGITTGDVASVTSAMTAILAQDSHWTLPNRPA